MKHCILYVPGIGDDLYHAQSIAVWCWRLLGVKAICHEMPWMDQAGFEEKLQRLLNLIDKAAADGYAVSLVGASAGASAVLHAYAARPDDVRAVVYICGKLNRPEAVAKRTYASSPAFRESMLRLSSVLQRFTAADKKRFWSLYSPADRVVPYNDTYLEGVTEKRLPNLHHGWAIMYAITVNAPAIIRHIKQLSAGLTVN